MIIDVSGALSTLMHLLLTPSSNLRAALALYAMIAVFVLLLMVLGIMFVLGTPEDEQAPAENIEVRPAPESRTPEVAESGRRGRAAFAVSVAVTLAAVWVVTGYSTSQPRVCLSCHAESAHAVAEANQDPHAQVDCVACHEPGGLLGRYIRGIPARSLHFVNASLQGASSGDYGHVTADACRTCHPVSVIEKTITQRGLKMSHAEPMAASATCTDCHRLRDGVVGAHNAGMRPCQPCHFDGRASAACGTCHAEDSGRARTASSSRRKPQIADISCGGCHDEARECDPCHGVRMPHSEQFKAGAHARAAAIDVWYEGGKQCGRCHDASRHSCTQCHSSLMGRAHGPAFASVHQSAQTDACNTCHRGTAYYATRDFCEDLCHSPDAIEASTR